MARVVVVGAGVGGLAAGVRLAAQGHDVTLCEAAPVVGGKLGRHVSATDAGAFTFDTGPTLLTLPQVFTDLFAGTGDPLPDVLPLRRLDTIAHYRFADGSTVDTVDDLDVQRRAFDAALGPGTGAAWQRVVDRGAAIWRAVEEPVFGTALSARALFSLGRRLARFTDLRAVAPHRTLRGVARGLLDDPRQRLMLERYATYEGSDPGGGRLPADVVVSDVDAHVLYGRLHRSRRPVPPADSLSGVVLLLAVRDPLPGLGHHTVLHGAAPYDDEFDAVFGARGRRPGRRGPGRPVADPVLYVNAPLDAAVAPPGCRAVYVLVNAPRHGSDGAPGTLDWTAPGLADSYAATLLDLLAARGLDVRSHLLRCDVRTPADLERDTGAPGGAIYGKVQHGALATVGRAHNRSRTRGLFLVGGSTHPGGGLPLVAISGQLVAAEIGPA